MELRRNIIHSFVTLALCSLFLLAMSCHSQIIPTESVNNAVEHYENFSVSTESVGLNTHVNGAVFVFRDEAKPKEPRLQIVAWMEIDPDDFGGITFRLPAGWDVANITSDYPENGDSSGEYIQTLREGAAIGYNRVWVEVGNGWTMPHDGGQGMIVIDIKLFPPQSTPPDGLELVVGAGSSDKNVFYPCFTRLQVPLTQSVGQGD